MKTANIDGFIEFTLNILRNSIDKKLVYHNVDHTLKVLDNVEFLSEKLGIDQYHKDLARVAATIHDTGFLYIVNSKDGKIDFDFYKKNENLAVEKFGKAYLSGYGFNPDEINIINKMVLATQMPQNLKVNGNGGNLLLNQIICDADLDYPSKPEEYKKQGPLYKKEIENIFTTPEIRKANGYWANDNDFMKLQVEFMNYMLEKNNANGYFTTFKDDKRMEGLKRTKEYALSNVKEKVR